MLVPIRIPIISKLVNKLFAHIPIIRRFTLTQCVIARPLKAPDNSEELTSSVILTCRDEAENIEGLVTRIPQMGKHTEIIFVEGHSKDNTVAQIQEMMKKYPQKDIKLYKQSGVGQGDAFRLGFDKARGDLLCWLEADLTIDPSEIGLFWDAYVSGRGEYINGTRMIYQMEKKSMPFLNFLGNRFFGNIFTPLLGQRFTDTLCGFKAVSKKNYRKIQKNMDYFGDFDPFGDFQLIFGAVKNGLKVAEIPVHYRPRQYGSSKAYGKSFLSFLKHAWLLIKMSWIAFIKFALF
jgi:glycosyltransferase involved in cell wall biosynthesis